MSGTTRATTTTTVASNSTFTAPARQIVPSAAAGSSSTGNDAGGSNFPTAAVIVVVIVSAAIGFFIAYKVYVWWYRKKHRFVVPLPEVRAFNGPTSPQLGPNNGSVDANAARAPRPSSTFGLITGAASMGRTREATWMTEGGASDSWTPSPVPNYISPGGTSPGTPVSPFPHSALTSRSPSPFGDVGGMPTSSSRASFSSASVNGPRRHMFGSNSVANAPHQMRSQPSSSRLSGAPHALHSRIDIVPPSPLAPPPGSVIAKDKTTLDFAPSSGIGKSGEGESETLIDVNKFALNRVNPGHEYRPSAFEQDQASRAYSQASGRPSLDESLRRGMSPPPHHRARASLGSVATASGPFHDSRAYTGGSSSSVDASPNSSSAALSTRQIASSSTRALSSLAMPPSTSPFPLSSYPASPLEKLQQRIAQQVERSSGVDFDSSSNSGGSGSSTGRSGSVAEVEGYQAPHI